MISKSCQYALRAVVLLASKPAGSSKLNVKYIAGKIDAPEAFTAKTLQLLARHSIINSLKGPNGGFFMEEHQLDTPIFDIVQATDGLELFSSCGLGMKQCSARHPCPFHHDYELLRNKLRETFEKTTIRKLAKKIEGGRHFLAGVEISKK